MDLNSIPSGYMLFVRVASIWYKRDDKDANFYKWLLNEEFRLPFLGTVSKLWSMLSPIQKVRWNTLCNDEYMTLLSYTTLDSLSEEMHEHIGSVITSLNLTFHT